MSDRARKTQNRSTAPKLQKSPPQCQGHSLQQELLGAPPRTDTAPGDVPRGPLCSVLKERSQSLYIRTVTNAKTSVAKAPDSSHLIR